MTPALSGLGELLSVVDSWPVPNPAVQLVGPDGGLASHGGIDRPGPIASVSKLLSAYAIMIGVTEGAVELDQPAGPPGSTVRHLLAHTAGYGFESTAGVVARPGSRRIYSNRGIEEAAATLEHATGFPFATYLHEAVLEPLGMEATSPEGSAAFGFTSTVADLSRFAGELLAPRLLDPGTVAAMIEVQFPGLVGVIPGLGRFDPCDWGLGFERNFGRAGHWTGSTLSANSFGHFGGAGSFLWVDPTRRLGCTCLTGREFGPWALDVWPALCAALTSGEGRLPGAATS